ncbi:efflux transporter outer membrane subunit [Parasphingorhabdus cellanae]|uniref:TolC family protein n=1 Tax=Parasphingorhabdus cellanae TaxID=2806553 RepID=A0ABX7T594_9SPHN|nr:TolC family protein [Parasphingorhabdus cellanae]QTD55287.1 TolC family protein [Parasphingorhabdus cellanae]
MTQSVRIALVLTASLITAGCSTLGAKPDPALDPVRVIAPGTFALASDVASQDRKTLEHLLPIDDPAFTALRAAVEDSAPTLAAALARIDAARAMADGAQANRLPAVDIDASVTRSRINPNNFGDNLPPGISIDRNQTSYGGNITANWDADIFGGLRASARAANVRIDAATADAAAVRLGLISAVAANIVDWRTLQARATVLEEDLTAAENLMRLTDIRAKAGIAPGLDAVQAQSLIADARSRLAALPGERAVIVGALVTLTGQDTATILQSLKSEAAETDAPQPPLDTPSEMLRARPDIAAAEARLAAADADIAAAAAQRFPKLTLSGAIGLLSFALGDLFSNDSVVGSLGAGIAGPLLDFGRVDAQIDQSKANAREAFAIYRGTVFTALGEAETAYGQVASIDAEVTSLTAQERLEKDAEYLLGIRYRNGLSDFRDVLNARRVLNNTRTQGAITKGRALRARVALWQALGGS